MARYFQSQITNSLVIATPAFEVRAAATGGPSLQEISGHSLLAASMIVGLGRPATVGTPLTPAKLAQENNPAGLSITTTAVAWSVAPTVPAQFLRRTSALSGIGAGFIYFFPRGIAIPSGQSVVVWNIASNVACGAAQISATVEE
jgi:hypothetical protein